MMILLGMAAATGGVGIFCILSRRTLFGVVIGIQLLLIGATAMIALSGIVGDSGTEGHLAAIFVALAAVAQLAAGSALSLRLFSERGRIHLESLRSMKR